MIRLILLLLVLVVSVWLGVKFSDGTGSVLFSYHQWAATMPLWFFVLALALLFIVLHYLWYFLSGVGHLSRRWQQWLQERRRYRANEKTFRGLMKLHEGDWRTAERYLISAAPNVTRPVINFLAAAKAAQELTAYERRDDYLAKAYQSAPQEQLAIGLTQAEFQYEQGQFELLRVELDRLHTLAPKNKQILKLQQKLYLQLEDWTGLLTLLPDLRKAKLISSEEAKQLQQKISHSFA